MPEEVKIPLRSRILHEATLLFSERGVDGTSMRMIAENLGVTKAAIYHYFASKDELHAAIHLARIDSALEEIERVASSDDNSWDKVRRLMTIMLNSIAAHRAEFTVLLREGAPTEPAHWHVLLEKRQRYLSLIEQVLAEGVESGAFMPYDTHAAMYAFVGMCNWSYTWIETDGATPVPEIADLFASIFLHGIAATTRPAMAPDTPQQRLGGSP